MHSASLYQDYEQEKCNNLYGHYDTKLLHL